jgi:hypothetical protein
MRPLHVYIFAFMACLALGTGQALAGATFGIKLPLSIANAAILSSGISLPELELGYETIVGDGILGLHGSIFTVVLYGSLQLDAYYRPQLNQSSSPYFGAGVGLEYFFLGVNHYNVHGLIGVDLPYSWFIELTPGLTWGQTSGPPRSITPEATIIQPQTTSPPTVQFGPSFYLRFASGFRFR